LHTSSCRHEEYANQYRAVDVDNCTVDRTSLVSSRGSEGSTSSSKPSYQRGKKVVEEDDDDHAVYHPVKCERCGTTAGVVEQGDGIFHLFNVIPSELNIDEDL
jgi:hypothetical protein